MPPASLAPSAPAPSFAAAPDPVAPVDPGLELENLDEEGPRLGGTPRGQAANAAVLALSRACRSFVLYDPTNEAIRKFLSNLQTKMQAALEGFGDLTLVVRPFELLLEQEVIYLERDRERSLAFRLYKDGVRKLQIDSRVTWAELLKLLEVMSVRTSVSAAQEDDLITLLRKSSFHYIHFEAAESYKLDDGSAEGGSAMVGTAVARSHIEAPHDWDQPLPEFGAPVLLVWRPVPDEILASLRAEVASGALASLCAQVMVGLVDAVADPTDPMTLEELLPMASEVRDFLLLQGDAEGLSLLVEATRRVDDGPAIAALFGTPQVFRRILDLILRREGHAALEYHLLPSFPALVVDAALARLKDNLDGSGTPTLLGLLRRFSPHCPEPVLTAAAQGEPALVHALLDIIEQTLPAHLSDLSISLLSRSEPEVLRDALRILRTQPHGPALANHLLPLLRSPAADVRQGAVDLLCKVGNSDTYKSLELQLMSRGASRDFGPDEAEATGQAMARIQPEAARTLFVDWLRPKRLLSRIVAVTVPPMRLRAAVAGLGVLPGDEGEAVLRELLPKADEDLRRAIFSALARRRNRGVKNG